MHYVTNTAPKLTNYLVGAVIAVVPFHAFLTVWASTVVGHYTMLRLWPEMIMLLLVCWLTFAGHLPNTCRRLDQLKIAWPIGLYLLVNVLYFVSSILWGEAGLLAASYSFLLNTRPVVWLVVVLSVALQSVWLYERAQALVFWPLLIVSVFALLQFFVLPPNILENFGYEKGVTIPASQTINQDTNTMRAQSFLRGPNPLGAYLLLGICLLSAATFRVWKRVALYVLAGLALLLSSSRSAWLGLILSGGVLALRYSQWWKRKAYAILVIVALIASSLTGWLMVQNHQGLKSAVVHVNDQSTAPQTSNEDRLVALKSGFSDVLREPFGRGLGTSGPASVYNKSGMTRNSENYFLSLGQEVGWLGLGLFVLICWQLGLALYRTRGKFAGAMFAAFIGLTLVNMLSYGWSDATLAYLWWGLAGVVLAHREDKVFRIQRKR